MSEVSFSLQFAATREGIGIWATPGAGVGNEKGLGGSISLLWDTDKNKGISLDELDKFGNQASFTTPFYGFGGVVSNNSVSFTEGQTVIGTGLSLSSPRLSGSVQKTYSIPLMKLKLGSTPTIPQPTQNNIIQSNTPSMDIENGIIH